jgi:hypothetical protein
VPDHRASIVEAFGFSDSRADRNGLRMVAIGRNDVSESEARRNGRAVISASSPFSYLNIFLAI